MFAIRIDPIHPSYPSWIQAGINRIIDYCTSQRGTLKRDLMSIIYDIDRFVATVDDNQSPLKKSWDKVSDAVDFFEPRIILNALDDFVRELNQRLNNA